MNFIFEADGKSKNEAIKKAIDALGITEDDATFVSEGSALLGLVSRKPVTVRVTNEKKKLTDDALIRGVTLMMVNRLGVEGEVIEVEDADENYVVQVESDDSGFLIGRQGRTLDAIQFLVNLLLNKDIKQKKRIIVDVAGYRERRRRYLRKLARNVASRVIKSGKSVLLDAMNPYERRIIHLELESDERIATESEGNSLYKRVRVMRIGEPAAANRKGRNPQHRDASTDDENFGNSFDQPYEFDDDDNAEIDDNIGNRI